MKIAVAFLALLNGANAFAPAQQSARMATAFAMSDLDGMLGVGPETANKIVRVTGYRIPHVYPSFSLVSFFRYHSLIHWD